MSDRGGASRPLGIAIVGMGPRGISVLERLAVRLRRRPLSRPVRVYAIDAVEVGAGRVWRTDQADWFTMNTVAEQVTMYSGDADGGPARPGAGPSLAQWLAGAGAGGSGDYASRLRYGQYLRSVFDATVAGLPANVEVHPVAGTVERIDRVGGSFRLRIGPTGQPPVPADLLVDDVVLCTGHPRQRAGATARPLVEFANRHPDVHYLQGDSAADLDLAAIAPGEAVGVLGLGLSFCDIMLSLTVGRGGRFVAAGDGLRYQPSGAEPVLVAGSRSGLPIPARGRNQKAPGDVHRPLFLTGAALERARDRRRAAGSGQLWFDRDVLPLLLLEVEHVFYRTHVRLRSGQPAAAGFELAHAEAAGRGPQARRAVLREFGLDGLRPPDLTELARPFRGQEFASPAAFREHLLRRLRLDLAAAELGNVDGPLKAALDVLRDIRDAVREAVDFGGLRPVSFQTEFLGRYVSVNSLLSAGPPIERVRQLVALLECGLLEIVGPDTRFEPEPATGRFVLTSAQVGGSARRVRVLIDARIPVPELHLDAAPLTRQLLADGLITEYVVTDPVSGDTVRTGGLAVTPAPFHVLDAAGHADPHLYALGIPTEHTRWFTQVGSSRPGGSTRFYRDADAIARSIVDTHGAPVPAAGGRTVRRIHPEPVAVRTGR
ncbi:MAG TPA: FAD/NAD(P)-binding protein [Mycobacteriales bacterium]|nr:FAD/NAD(P)-binding protein [Mycobacteriales bacterium]